MSRSELSAQYNYLYGHFINKRKDLCKIINAIISPTTVTNLFYIDTRNQTITDPVVLAVMEDDAKALKKLLKTNDKLVEYEVGNYTMKLLIDYNLTIDYGENYPFIKRYRKINLLELAIILKAYNIFQYLTGVTVENSVNSSVNSVEITVNSSGNSSANSAETAENSVNSSGKNVSNSNIYAESSDDEIANELTEECANSSSNSAVNSVNSSVNCNKQYNKQYSNTVTTQTFMPTKIQIYSEITPKSNSCNFIPIALFTLENPTLNFHYLCSSVLQENNKIFYVLYAKCLKQITNKTIYCLMQLAIEFRNKEIIVFLLKHYDFHKDYNALRRYATSFYYNIDEIIDGIA